MESHLLCIDNFLVNMLCQWTSISITANYFCSSTCTVCIASNTCFTGYVVHKELIWDCLQVKQATSRHSRTIAFWTQHYFLIWMDSLGCTPRVKRGAGRQLVEVKDQALLTCCGSPWTVDEKLHPLQILEEPESVQKLSNSISFFELLEGIGW